MAKTFKRYENVEIGGLVKDMINQLEQKYLHKDVEDSDYSMGDKSDLLRIYPGTVNIVAGDYSFGNSPSVLAYNMLNHICIKNKIPSGIICFENSRQVVTRELLSIVTGVSQRRLKESYLRQTDFNDITNNVGDLYDSPLYIYEPTVFSIDEVCDSIQSLVDKDVKVIYIENLQFLNSKVNSDGTLDFSRTMKKLKEAVAFTDVGLIVGFTFPRLENNWMKKKRRGLREENLFYLYPGIVQASDSVTVLSYWPDLKQRIIKIHTTLNKFGCSGSVKKIIDLENLQLKEMV